MKFSRLPSLSPWSRSLPALPLALLVLSGCSGAPRSQAPVPPVATPAAARPESAPTVREATPEQMRQLAADLRPLLGKAPAQAAAVYVQDLQSGRTCEINADQRYLAASLIKLPVMGAVYELWERKPQLRTSQAEQWMDAMITLSDNPSTDRLVDLLGGTEVVNRYCRKKGWTVTKMGSKILARPIRSANQCSAREVGELLALVEHRKLVNETADAEMWDMLVRQTMRTRIPAGVPKLPGVVVGNKTGTITKVLHDAGIVHTPRTRYALCILLSRYRSRSSGEQFCRRVSRLVFNSMHGPADGEAQVARH